MFIRFRHVLYLMTFFFDNDPNDGMFFIPGQFLVNEVSIQVSYSKLYCMNWERLDLTQTLNTNLPLSTCYL